MIKKYSYILFIPLISVLLLFLSFPSEALKGKRSADDRYVDNGNGTITDTKTDLMWTKKDSYADLRECLDWNASKSYVSRLNTGGHSNWRLPTIQELKRIYEESKKIDSGVKALGIFGIYDVHLDSVFASGGAIWHWSSETAGSCCARFVNFSYGTVSESYRDGCRSKGVRAVRR